MPPDTPARDRLPDLQKLVAEEKALLEKEEAEFHHDYLQDYENEVRTTEHSSAMDADYADLAKRRNSVKEKERALEVLREEAVWEGQRELFKARGSTSRDDSKKAIHFVRSRAAWGATAILAGIFSLAVAGQLDLSAREDATRATLAAGATLTVAAGYGLVEAGLYEIIASVAYRAARETAEATRRRMSQLDRLIRQLPALIVLLELGLALVAGSYMVRVVMAAARLQ